MIQVFQDVPYVLVPHGCFFMGSDKGLPLETPVHERKIESSFLLGMYPVTQKAWLEVMGSSLSWFRSDDLLPVENITWHDAQLFCGQLGAMIG
jgi:formylglycine-generating enzyme required for sulfatase activity